MKAELNDTDIEEAKAEYCIKIIGTTLEGKTLYLFVLNSIRANN